MIEHLYIYYLFWLFYVLIKSVSNIVTLGVAFFVVVVFALVLSTIGDSTGARIADVVGWNTPPYSSVNVRCDCVRALNNNNNECLERLTSTGPKRFVTNKNQTNRVWVQDVAGWKDFLDGVLFVVLVYTCSHSSVPVLPSCAQRALRSLRAIKTLCPPVDKGRPVVHKIKTRITHNGVSRFGLAVRR